ncbi:MAG: HypC/HybG/HupF family hydrogenase formation chaperone [Deltaproteobacteria bacterium]
MCLAIPGRVVEIFYENGIKMGKVDFDGVSRKACFEYVPELELGDYALVHVGFALSKVDEEEARKVFEFLDAMNELGELAGDDEDEGN